MDTLRNNFVRITTPFSYEDTIKFCNVNKQFLSLCNSNAYWNRKAKANYDFDLNKLDTHLSPSMNYRELEKIMEGSIDDMRIMADNIPKYTRYIWNKKIQNEFGIVDAIDEISNEDLFRLIYILLELSGKLPGNRMHVNDVSFMKEVSPNSIKFIIQHGGCFGIRNPVISKTKQNDIKFMFDNIQADNLLPLLINKIVLNEKRYADMIYLLSHVYNQIGFYYEISDYIDPVATSIDDDPKALEYMKQTLKLLKNNNVYEQEDIIEFLDGDDNLSDYYKNDLLDYVQELFEEDTDEEY